MNYYFYRIGPIRSSWFLSNSPSLPTTSSPHKQNSSTQKHKASLSLSLTVKLRDTANDHSSQNGHGCLQLLSIHTTPQVLRVPIPKAPRFHSNFLWLREHEEEEDAHSCFFGYSHWIVWVCHSVSRRQRKDEEDDDPEWENRQTHPPNQRVLREATQSPPLGNV